MSEHKFEIRNPLVVMFEAADGNVICHLYPSDRASSHKHYGLLICDLIRHVADAFKVDEEDVWTWVEKERRAPTTQLTKPS